jgi:hypothetical protein
MIKEEWKEYYFFLEALRRTGVCNMFGADIYLREAFPLNEEESREILLYWIEYYNELDKVYGWQNER